jgi:hypothetical protein
MSSLRTTMSSVTTNAGPVGNLVGTNVGETVGTGVGDSVGESDGAGVGDLVGTRVGDSVGLEVGTADGTAVGLKVGGVGDKVGDCARGQGIRDSEKYPFVE